MSPSSKQFWQFRNSADDDSAELLFYGPISDYSWWGDEVTPQQFNDDLAALGPIKNLKVRINSPGGDVFAAAAIHNSLRNHSANVTAYVDGLAASAASVVAMAGDKIVMPKTAMMMIHNPSSFAWGDARDLRATADVLDKVRDSIIGAYERKTGMDRAKLINLMNSETWMTAQDALDMGFADEVDEQLHVNVSMRGRLMIVNGLGFELDRFKTVPAAFLVGGNANGEEVNNLSTPVKNNNEEPETPATEPETAAEEPEEVVDGAGTPAGVGTESPEEPEADPVQNAVAAERKRISDIRALATPGAEEIIENAINSGADPRDVAVEILRSGKVKNAAALVARAGESPNIGGGGSTPAPEAKKVNSLIKAINKIRGIKDPE
jgi:ATP-dependent protease ClpP protease subunit